MFSWMRRCWQDNVSYEGGLALIWMDFMKVYLEKYGDRKNPPQFEAPGNIVFVTLDSGVAEAFINGTQPQTGLPAEPAVTPAPSPPSPDPPAVE